MISGLVLKYLNGECFGIRRGYETTLHGSSSFCLTVPGRIEDADFALETTRLAKGQILQQASTAILAQANASKQNVLGLLRS